jgi:DNA-binding NtrC family response regulator
MCKATILVAEDEPLLRWITVEALEECGFRVFEATDGTDALRVLKAHSDIALLISDVRMPGMDGYALVVAGLQFRPELKVILMTGYAPDPPQAVTARKLKTFHKPFDIEELCLAADAELAEH